MFDLGLPGNALIVLAFIVATFIIWIWALTDCLKSRLSTEEKLVWVIVILIFHVLGAILYFLLKGKIKMKNLKNKKLIRKRNDKILGGVCSGLGEYLELDKNIVRLLWVIITVFTGVWPGVIVYIVAWAIIPEETQSKKPVQKKTKAKKKTK